MALESATYIADLVATNPISTDPKGQGDDHLRLLKSTIKSSFPNADRAFYIPFAVAAKSANYNVASSDENCLVPFNASAAARTANLPSLSAALDGWEVLIQKTDSSSNAVIIDPPGAATINGASTISITKQYEAVLVKWDGSGWTGWYLPTKSVVDVLMAPSGTKMLFQQTAAPTGWTKDTAHNDKALRVVSGTASSGGTNSFSTVMAQSAVGGTSITQAQLPATVAIPLTYTNTTGSYAAGAALAAVTQIAAGTSLNTDITLTSVGGSGTAHDHPITMGMQYVDVIIATKD